MSRTSEFTANQALTRGPVPSWQRPAPARKTPRFSLLARIHAWLTK